MSMAVAVECRTPHSRSGLIVVVGSLPKVCVAVGVRTPGAMRATAESAFAAGDRFVELRLDMLNRPASGVAVIEELRAANPKSVILATCRLRENTGEFDGTIEKQQRILLKAIEAGAQLVDLEIETAEAAPGLVGELRRVARVVLSYHDFDRTPALPAVLRRMRKIPADVYKLATMVVKPSDNQRLLDLLDSDAPVMTLGMSELGAPSRILGPSRGSVFTFASPPLAEGTAPGQFSGEVMRQSFRAHLNDRSTKLYGVIADPVGHSMSPTLHNRAFRAKRYDGCYLPLRVKPSQLGNFFKLFSSLPLEGLSVTIPHKQAVGRHLAGIDPLAKRIGAVNTVYRKKGKPWGTNSDAIGVTAPLECNTPLRGKSALVIGTGGAARGAVFALADKGAKVTVVGRNRAKAARLAKAAGIEAIAWDAIDGYDVLVHCTPVGMHPNEDDTLFPDSIPADLVFDIVYNPLETVLLRHAKAQGKATIGGLEMFVEQAAAQFEIWTGDEAPRKVMRQAVLEVLEGK